MHGLTTRTGGEEKSAKDASYSSCSDMATVDLLIVPARSTPWTAIESTRPIIGDKTIAMFILGASGQKHPPNFKTAMVQCFEKGKPTEIEFLMEWGYDSGDSKARCPHRLIKRSLHA